MQHRQHEVRSTPSAKCLEFAGKRPPVTIPRVTQTAAFERAAGDVVMGIRRGFFSTAGPAATGGSLPWAQEVEAAGGALGSQARAAVTPRSEYERSSAERRSGVLLPG